MESPPNQPAGERPQQTPETLPAWKKELLRSFYEMVETMPDEAPPEPPAPEDDETSPPTLEEFYKALIALEANTRKNVQKTNASLETVAKSLRALQRQMSQTEERAHAASTADPSPWLALDGQLRRMLDRMQNPPPPSPLGLSRKWQTAWDEITNGAQIIRNSFGNILDEQGIRSRSPAPGTPFDPACMEAVKISPAPQASPPAATADEAEVLEVIEPAYYQNEKLIRAARVHVRR